jgi:predicted nucleotidyltransferase
MLSEAFLSRMQNCEDKNPTHGYAKLAHEVLADTLTDRAAELLTPNNILALEYLKALKRIGSNIEPHTVLREGTDYRAHEIDKKAANQSASAIREALCSGDLSSAEYIPEAA